jgi:DNA-binding NarL/FixJ family response regulator
MVEFNGGNGAFAGGAAAPAEPNPARLSPRELQVLELASLGLTNSQIAGRLTLSVHAVKFHLAAVYRKLEVANRTEAAFVFLNRYGSVGQAGTAGA